MKNSKISILFAVLVALVLLTGGVAESATNSAKVTYISGKAYKGKNKTKGPWYALRRNRTVTAGYYIKTDEGARVELTLPDNSKIRVAGNSVLYLSSARFGKGVRNYRVSVDAGKVYTRAAPSKNEKSTFTVRSGGAVAGIRGTAFNTILLPDGSTRVKCYEGKVWVASWSDYAERGAELVEPEKAGDVNGSVQPKQVNGPKQVGGPKQVSEEEWKEIVGAMTSVTLGPDGKVQGKEEFSDDDLDDWEEWNKERDERYK